MMKALARPLLALLMLVLALGACWSPTASPDVERLVLYVEAHTVDCVGEGARRCLLVREDPDESWTYFYQGIDGFTYVPGFRYTLEVEVRLIRNPPADGPSSEYRLVRVIEKVAA